MNNNSRLFLLGALVLVLLSAACAGQQPSPTAVPSSTPPANPTITSLPTEAGTETVTTTVTPDLTLTPGIPVTGLTVSLVCQFCIDAGAHALLTIPAGTTVTVVTPTASVSSTVDTGTQCNVVETLNDKQLVLCRGTGNTVISLNICSGSNCQQATLRLQTCPPVPVNTSTLTPTTTRTLAPTAAASATATFTAPAPSPTGAPSSTPTTGAPSATPTITFTPTPTATP